MSKLPKLAIAIALCLALSVDAWGALNLAWQDNSTGETGFILERQLNGGAFAVLTAAIAANLISYSDGTAIGSTVSDNVYCYRIKAFDAIQESGYSNTACATIPKIKQAPNAATGLTLNNQPSPKVPNVVTGLTLGGNPASKTPNAVTGLVVK